MSKTLHRNLQAKISALQGPEWDSSDEEGKNVAPPVTKKAKGPKDKKLKQKIKKAKESLEEETHQQATVIYVGHLPNEFEERDLKNFVSQFGKVPNIRISRSVKTGTSRGYAFVKFAEASVAQVVAETLQGYFMGNRRLVCHLVPNPPPGLFFNTDKVIALRQQKKKAEAQRRNRDLANVGKLKEITARLLEREQKKRSKLADLGIDYEFPGIAAIHGDEATEEPAEEPAETTPKKRKNSVDRTTPKKDDTGSSKKSKRKDSIGSEGSKKRSDSVELENTPVVLSDKKKKKRKDSIGSEGSKKRSESVELENTPVVQSDKKKKRKDSIGSEGSKKRSKSIDLMEDSTPTKEVSDRTVQSDKKKRKKNKKRRVSAP